MARDKPDGRERREGRERDRGRERVDDHDDRAGGDLRERLRAVETLATDTAHLASTSAFRFGGYAASKGLVYFVSGDLTERLSRRWTEWKRTASLEPSQRPTAKPKPWKLQIYDALLKTARGSRMPGLQKRFAGTLVLARSWGLGRFGACLVGRTSACSCPTKAGERLDNGGRPSVKASTVAVLSEGNTYVLELEDWIFCSVKAFLVVVGAVRLPSLVWCRCRPAQPANGCRPTGYVVRVAVVVVVVAVMCLRSYEALV